MIPKINIDKESLEKLLAKLSATTKYNVIEKTLKDGADRVIDWAIKNRLRGPKPGILMSKKNIWRSLAKSDVKINGNEFSIAVGSNIAYARIHEYGYNKIENVRAHLRKKGVVTGINIVTGRSIKIGTILSKVKSHTRFMKMPARRYLRPAIANIDNRQKMLDDFVINIKEAYDKA